MAIGKFNSGGGGYQIPPVGFVWLSTENVSPEIYFENTTWELISQNRVLMGAGDGHSGGDTVEAGLPNIVGTFKGRPHTSGSASYGGALVQGDNKLFTFTKHGGGGNDTGVAESSTHSADDLITFNASKYNSIYGNSTTVQPPAFYVYMWRRAS